MRYKVPQNIDLEDKVIGPLTLKQFIFLLVGGMLDYIIYNSLNNWLGWVLIIVISGLALAFAFVKIRGQDFSYFLSAFFSYTTSPKVYVWEKMPNTGEEEIPKVKKEEKEEDDQLTKDPKQVKSRLQVLAEIVDTKGWQDKDTGNRVVSDDQPEKPVEKVQEKKEGIDDPLNKIEPS
jgi:hypothetical protein